MSPAPVEFGGVARDLKEFHKRILDSGIPQIPSLVTLPPGTHGLEFRFNGSKIRVENGVEPLNVQVP